MLGFKHIAYMVFVLIVTITFHILVKKKRIDFEKMLKACAIIALTLDPLYWVWEYRQFGTFRYETTLPLYICSLFWMLLPVIAFSKKKANLYRASVSCLTTVVYYGGIMGLIFNYHVSNHPFFGFVVQRSLFYHFLMFMIVTLMWSTGYYRVQKRDTYLFFVPLLVLMIPAFVVDRIYGSDYCYFNGGKGSVFEYFSDALGIPLFVILLYGLMFLSIHFVLKALYKKHSK